MSRDITPQDEASRFSRLREKHGYDAFKFRVGAECGRNQDQWPGRSEEIVKTVREVLGSDVDLLVDGNSCYRPETAIELGKVLADHGICHFEEPCPYWEYEWTKQVTDALPMDVTGGEQDNNLALWQYMIDNDTVDIYQPDICYMGGIERTLRVVKMAADADKIITPHAGPYVEFSIEDNDYYPWQYGIYHDFPLAKDGKVQIPEGPGWGIDICPSWLEQSNYQISESDESFSAMPNMASSDSTQGSV